MARAPLQADFAAFIDATVVPALRALQLPIGDVANPLHLKLLGAAFLPLSVVFLFVAIVRGHFSLHRFLGLYITLFLVSVASGWLNYRIVKADAAVLSLEGSVFSHEGVPVEAILHHVFAALLLASFHFALQKPGLARHSVGSAVYLRVWGLGLFALLYGYAHFYLPHRQFLFARLVAELAYPILAVQYLLAGHVMLENGLKGLSTSLSAIAPTLYSLLPVAAAHQLGFIKISADSVLGARYFGVPVEEIASYVLLSTVVVQALLIWEGLAEPARPTAAEVRARLVPMAKQSAAKGNPQKESASDKERAAASPKEKAAKGAASPQATAAAKAPATPEATGSPSGKAKSSPQVAKKKASQ